MSDDTLLACLVHITHHIGRPVAEGALLSCLPINEERLNIDVFPRAASHAGLNAKHKKFILSGKEPHHYHVPVVLLLKEDKACLLLNITNHNTAKIMRCPNKVEEEISLDELNAQYTGQAFLMEYDLKFGLPETAEGDAVRGKAWFWGKVNMLWLFYSEILIASLLINLFALAVPLFVMSVYNRVIPNNIFDTLWVLSSGIVVILGFDLLMRVLRGYFIDKSARAIDLEVSATLLERILGIRMVNRPLSVGSFANTIQSFESIREFISSATITILIDLPFSLLFLLVIGIIGGYLVLVPLIIFPLVVVISLIFQRSLVEYTQLANRYSGDKQAILYEILSGIESVKTNCAEHVMQNRWEQLSTLASSVGVKLHTLTNFGLFISVFAQQLATVIVIIGGVYEIYNNNLTVGGLIACSILTGRALAPMSQVASLLARLHKTKNSLESLDKIMHLPLERPEGYAGLSVHNIKGDIELRDVKFQYPDQALPVLEKISIKINAGEKVAILGCLGSGKTTIAKLLLGLLQPTSGSIFIDGLDQGHYDLNQLRKQIGYVPQDITLFSGSLHENITMGMPDIDDAHVINALQISGADEFIKQKLGDYEAMITERGKNLSGGQKQIIAIARAVLFDPPIMVLDEPTNALDNKTEKIIIEKLSHYMKNKTLLLMTHHPSLLSLVDRIVIIDSGSVIADGSKEAILKALSEGKIFAKSV